MKALSGPLFLVPNSLLWVPCLWRDLYADEAPDILTLFVPWDVILMGKVYHLSWFAAIWSVDEKMANAISRYVTVAVSQS